MTSNLIRATKPAYVNFIKLVEVANTEVLVNLPTVWRS